MNIVTGAADEVLKNHEKKVVIEKLLYFIPDHVFDQLIYIGRTIADFHDAGGSSVTYDEDALGNDIGLAVEFDENGAESDLDMVHEDDEEEEGMRIMVCRWVVVLIMMSRKLVIRV